MITFFIDNNSLSINTISSLEIFKHIIDVNKPKDKLNILELPEFQIIDSDKILKGSLTQPKDILFLLPISPEFRTNYTFKIMVWAKSKGLIFDDYWAWYSKKNNSNEKYKHKLNTWGHIDLKFTPSDNSIFNILRRYYPNFDLLKETYDFKKLCNISNEQYMNIDYLDKSHFKFEDNKAIIFNLGILIHQIIYCGWLRM